MLFDLQGKRRRLVQVTYLTLAILMGGGLVLFGIGSDAQGGLLNGCSEETTGDAGSEAQQRIDAAAERLAANPRDEAALADVVRGNYQLANDLADPSTGTYSPEGVAKLQAASDAWQRYLELDPKPPDDSLAGLMVQAYGLGALNDPEKGADAAAIVAEARPTPQNYLALAQFATLAGETRQADLAGERAVELAPKAQRKAVEDELEALDRAAKELAASQGQAGGAPAEGGAPPGAVGGAPPPAGGGGGSPGGGQP